MAEYIDIDGRVVVTDTRGRERETTVRHILEMNKGVFTAADVRPVVRGKWVQVMGKYDWMVKCSRCKGVPLETSSFCPNCGADMREES